MLATTALPAPPPVEAPRDPVVETLACAASPGYFLDQYGWIYDATLGDWIPFHLWPAQVAALATIHRAHQTVILKARQLGMTWIVLGYILWLMLFRPVTTALVFSKREEEAKYLLSEERLHGMYTRLPPWLQLARPVRDSTTRWRLSNGSVAQAFPGNGGDGRTASIALADEFDLLDLKDQGSLFRAVKPTIDGGGKMVLLSKAHKDTPLSPFKRTYQAAPGNGWARVFLPWFTRPDRSAAWYAATATEIAARTGGQDELHENYPATDTEALLPPQQAKRLPGVWLLPCQAFTDALAVAGAPDLADLVVYTPPVADGTYCIGADPAEGNPSSDESAACVVRQETGAQVAVYAGKVEPTTFAGGLAVLAAWYNGASVLVERNNHGGTVLAGLGNAENRPTILRGPDGRAGWLTTAPSKISLYDAAAETLRDETPPISDRPTWHQLASIDGNTLSAPSGQADDRAMAWILAQRARAVRRAGVY